MFLVHQPTMKKLFYLLPFLFLASCGERDNKPDNNAAGMDSTVQTNESPSSNTLTDKTVLFFSRDSNGEMVINEELCKTISDYERAALGYIATFIGSECWWDGEAKEDSSNLKCRILTALNLGYQCSDKHLGFLRKMFKNDAKVLEELALENCPTTPHGATSQNAFEEITLTVKGNKILVFFKASGINLREEQSWSWSETNHFLVDNDNIKLVKKDRSNAKREKVYVGEG